MAERYGTVGPIGEELLAHAKTMFGFWAGAGTTP